MGLISALAGEESTRAQLTTSAHLVVFSWSDEQRNAFDTRSIRSDDGTDEQEDAAGYVSGQGDAFLIPVVKSSRNPFAQLITLGRATNNDLVLASENVSKVHAWFLNTGPTGWVLQDNGSTNGTVHNDTPLEERGSVPLRFGDSVGFAGVRAIFTDADGVLKLAKNRGS